MPFRSWWISHTHGRLPSIIHSLKHMPVSRTSFKTLQTEIKVRAGFAVKPWTLHWAHSAAITSTECIKKILHQKLQTLRCLPVCGVISTRMADIHCQLSFVIHSLKCMLMTRIFIETVLTEIKVGTTSAMESWPFNWKPIAAITPSDQKEDISSIHS